MNTPHTTTHGNEKTRNARRIFLKGMGGAAVGLPWLETFHAAPLLAAGKEAAQTTPKRMAFIFFPNGAIMPDWTPKGTGKDFQLSKTLSPLADVKDDCLFISGLAHDKARANGDGPGDHARCTAAYLTAAQPRKTGGADIHLGVSVDQVAAKHVGEATPLPSLELGIEAGRQAGACDSGYACAYQSNIAWRSENQPVAKEINPKLAFERLFGMSAQDAKKRKERDFYRTSILDLVTGDANRLQGKLSGTDRQKLDEYFSSVRDIEKRIGRAATEREIPDDFVVPAGVPKDVVEHTRLMYEILALAFQTDSTRIATYMLANGGSNLRYTHLDIKEGHHQMSHHRDKEDLVKNLQKIDEYMVAEFGRFLKKLKATPEGEGNLLDHSMIVYGSAISDGNRHWHHDLPVVLAGRGAGTIDTGRHLKLEKETPMANLFVSMLQRMDCPVSQFGDSTGELSGLS